METYSYKTNTNQTGIVTNGACKKSYT